MNKRLVDFCTLFSANPELSELVKPRQRALNNPAETPQAASMRSEVFADQRFNDSVPEFFASLLRRVSPVAEDKLRPRTRTSHLAANLGNPFDQREKLGHIVNVRPRQARGQRNSVPIREHVMLASRFGSIRRIGACFLPSAEGSARGAIDDSFRPIDLFF